MAVARTKTEIETIATIDWTETIEDPTTPDKTDPRKRPSWT